MNHLFFTRRQHATRLSRACAALLTALTLLLVVLAACPEAHEWLHPDAGHADHDCVITLFAHGVTAAVVPVALGLIAWRLVRALICAAVDFDLASPRYRLLPGRAPPAR